MAISLGTPGVVAACCTAASKLAPSASSHERGLIVWVLGPSRLLPEKLLTVIEQTMQLTQASRIRQGMRCYLQADV